jgi:hypothetical protein
MGWMDEEGYIYLTGRADDMIIRGGENISPEEVEDVLRSNGVERRFWLICSRPELPYPWVPGQIMIQKPNPVTFSSEFQRTRGYACQVTRAYCWEEPKGEYKRMWECWGDLRRLALKELRPGHPVEPS